MKTFLLNIILIIAVSCIWSACGNADHAMEQRLFGNMDSLLEANPDSAYAALKDLQGKVDSVDDEAIRMRHILLLADAENKLDKAFPSEQDMVSMADYFDRHGRNNERIKSHYLLGCYYQRQGDSPLAISIFNKALSLSDTLANDCDYKTMMHICGQMAMLFRQQFLPEEEIESWRLYSRYADKTGDLYNRIRGLEFMTSAYYTMGDSTHFFSLTKKCHELYLANGMPEAAASVWALTIYHYTKIGKADEAKKLMEDFEQNSGLFDKMGNIVSDREDYYFTKGQYYTIVNKLDSAELSFRKLRKPQFDYYKYKGLLQIYQARQAPDSIEKYSKLYTQGVENMLDEKSTAAVKQSTSLYNYNKSAREAELKEIEAVKLRWVLIIITLLFSIMALYTYMRAKQKKLLRRKELDSLNTRLIYTTESLENANNELSSMTELYEALQTSYRQSQEMLSKEKEAHKNLLIQGADTDDEFKRVTADLEELQQKNQTVEAFHQAVVQRKKNETERIRSEIEAIKREINKEIANDEYKMLCDSETVQTFKNRAISRTKKSQLSQTEWNKLLTLVKQYFPLFYAKLTNDGKLTNLELHVCILVFLKFSPGDIAFLLERSSQHITNLQSSSNQKLFSEKSSKTLRTNLDLASRL